jgi:FkbM family methyltransferase
MKTLIKRLIPKPLMPAALWIWKLFDNTKTVDISKEYGTYEALNTLQCKVAYNKYGGYCVPLSSHHRPAAQKILSNDVYEPKTIAYMLNNCNNGDIVHAGTYFGDFLPALSRGVVSGAKVWAFEPNPENYRCAKITLEINDIKNTVLTNAGIGSKKETLLVKTRDAYGRALGGASQIIKGNANDEVGTESVQIVTIDDVVDSERNVSIIQLDVEGHEKEALKGALTTIKRCLPTIILEVLPKSTLLGSDWFSINILSLGYRKIHNIDGNSVFSCKVEN